MAWTGRDELAGAVERLGVPHERFRFLPHDESGPLLKRIEEQFVDGHRGRWWWEHWRDTPVSRTFVDDQAFLRVAQLVPDPRAPLYFVFDEEPESGVALSDAETVTLLLGECPAFEYGLVALSLDWLVFENHHGVLMALGEPVETRLRALGA